MSYNLLLGLAVGLSVLFFWVGRQFARSSAVETGSQLDRFLDESSDSTLFNVVDSTPAAPGFIERVIAPLWRDGLRRIGNLTPNHNLEVIAKRLDTAGRPHGLNVLNFLGLKFIAAAVFAVVGFLLFVVVLHQPITIGLLFLLIFAIIGFYVPNVWLGAVIRSRQRAILRALPDALDMIVVSTEAGQGFDQALKRVSDYWPNVLTEEFDRILAEIVLGRTRHEALTSASERIQLTEMSNLIAAIIQADELGVSIGKVLRIQADQLRIVRRQRAEELAHQAAIKMLFPLVFLIFPAMFAVLLGPAIPLLIETLSGLH